MIGRDAAYGHEPAIRNVRYMAAFEGDPDIEPTSSQGRV